MKNIKKLVNFGLILILGILLGVALIVVAYMLPTNRIKENIKKSINTFEDEGPYCVVVNGYIGTQLDNFTDTIMLSNAIYDGNDSIIEKSMKIYRYKYSGENPTEQLVQSFLDKEIITDKISYSQYWHGYLVFLKPILLFFSYSDIRIINQIVQVLLIVLISYLLAKRNINEHIPPFIIGILSIVPGVVSLSLQFSTTMYIFLISIAIVLIFYEKLKEKYIYLFLILGMITSFLDFLTCPILTLGMPMIYLIILNKDNWKKDLINIIRFSIMWGIGYAGMWMGKWIISSILLQENLITDALDKILERTSNENAYGSFTRNAVIKRNLELILTIPNILMIVANFIYIFYKSIKMKLWKNKRQYLKILPFTIIASMPFAWYFLVSNHSFIHYWFTYRNLAISIVAILSGITIVLLNNEMEKEKT